ncbi:MAG: nucleolar RNA-binding Nop10p family protein [Nanoarchaeota archaeon]
MRCQSYTLLEEHCGMKTFSVRPAKYSPIDRMGVYRRRYKESVMED